MGLTSSSTHHIDLLEHSSNHFKAEAKLKESERKASKAIVREIDANEKFTAEAGRGKDLV